MKVWWTVSDGRADGMAVGYSPVCVFLPRTQLFHNEWQVLFLGREVRHTTCPVGLFIQTVCPFSHCMCM